MAVDVVGIGVRVGAVGSVGWFCRRFAIRSICFFNGRELFLRILFIVWVFLLGVINPFVHGLHEGV